MIIRKWPSIMGDVRGLYFENSIHPPAGHLIQAGMATPGRRNDWWDVRDLRSFPYYNFSIILESGAGFYRDENGYSCQLSFGNFILIPPGLKQYYGPGKDEYWSELCVSFNGALFKTLQRYKIIHKTLPVWHVGQSSLWIERLQPLLAAPRPTSHAGIIREAAAFLALLLEILENASPASGGEVSSDWFENACVMLTVDLSQKVDLQQIARNLGMSYHTFRTYFAQRAGRSPIEYRNVQRIKTACHFLKSTTAPCRDIAFRMGYATEQRFSADFKQKMGMPPSEYRKQAIHDETHSI